ncbi:variable surface protein Vir4g [Plasmodium vivax North Korean]|uniref:Variable surface protein Vir4g n=1 Tax=Plasmodium vivax North Korean TaxID=1035514 RepID=A0A0J9U289_PLAVI|nr:variable surface protein Vir4g [Plasmodium vivax North Korean]
MERSYQHRQIWEILFKFIGRCKLINYWLYDEVKKILASETRDIYKDTIRELHKSWKDYNAYGSYRAKKYRCNPESNIPSKDDIDDKKKIHEHCLNYYEISKKKDNNDDCQEYKVYIKGLNLPYTKFDSLFPKDEHNYSSYYSKCRTYNPENILKDSICPQEAVIHQPPAKETVTEEQQTLARTNHRAPEPEEEGSASLAAEGGLGVGKVDGELREDQRQGQTGVDQRRVHVEVDVGTEGLTSMGREEQNLVTDLDKESTPLHSQVGEQTVDGLNPTGAPVSNSMVMPASLSLFGIASLSTILYKVCKN